MITDFAKKDMESFYAHDQDYVKVDPFSYTKDYKENNIYQQFDMHGYKTVIEAHPEVKSMHIDLGCGGGWLLEMTAPHFKQVVGIDPSKAALAGAREVTKELDNVKLIQGDMVEVLRSLDLTKPLFITTATVLSHIKDEWVIELLKIINQLPKGSILTFGEPHGKNIQRHLWYIRDSEWWAKHLNNWQLIFNDKMPFGYKYSFIGINVGEKNVLQRYKKNFLQLFLWVCSGIYYKIRNFFADLIKPKKYE